MGGGRFYMGSMSSAFGLRRVVQDKLYILKGRLSTSSPLLLRQDLTSVQSCRVHLGVVQCFCTKGPCPLYSSGDGVRSLGTCAV